MVFSEVSGQNPPGQNPLEQKPLGQNPLGQNPLGVGQNPTCLSFKKTKEKQSLRNQCCNMQLSCDYLTTELVHQ